MIKNGQTSYTVYTLLFVRAGLCILELKYELHRSDDLLTELVEYLPSLSRVYRLFPTFLK